MLFPSGLSRFSFTYDNWGANPSATPGMVVTPGASNVEGSWTAVASSSDIAQDCYWIGIRIAEGATSSQIKSHLLDVGVDPAGGTSYTEVISNIVCGAAFSTSNRQGGHFFLFPIFIKAGSSVAVRIQGSNVTAGTVRVCIKFYGQPSDPDNCLVGTFAETIGSIASSQGTSFTPGNAADGSWTSLGTTTNNLWWWQICYQVSNTTVTVEETYIDIAYGDASNKVLIMRIMHIGSAIEECGPLIPYNLNFLEAYCPVPAGSNIYVRGRCLNAPDTGYNAVAIGIGGNR